MRLPRSLAALLAALLVPFAFVFLAPAAWAHDRLVSTDPSSGANVPAAKQITLTFSDTVIRMGTQVRLSGPNEVVQASTDVQGEKVTVTPAAALPPGSYTVAWRVTSADGHPISGTFGFTVAGSAASSGNSSTTSSGGLPASASSSGSASGGGLFPATSVFSSTSATQPAKQTPTKKTDNMPGLVLGGAVLALLLIGGGVMLAKNRLRDDEPAEEPTPDDEKRSLTSDD